MRAIRAALALSIIAVAGCGGGGGGGSSLPSASPGGVRPTVAPTATPTPAASASAAPAPLPTVGYLSSSATGLSGTTSAGTSTVTLAAISETAPSPRPAAPGFVAAGVQVSVGAAGTKTLVRRPPAAAASLTLPAPPRVSLSAESAVDAAGLRAAFGAASKRASPAAAAAAGTASPAPSARTFEILNGGIGPTATTYVQVPASLAQTTAHGYLYVDNSLPLLANVTAGIASDFENAYLVDTTHFGTATYADSAPNGPLNFFQTPCDASGNPISGAVAIPAVISDSDPHVDVVVVSQANAGNAEGGYFDPANYFVQSYANCSHKLSNGVPMIVLVWPSNGSPTYELGEDMVRVTAHEMQHLINFVNHCVLAPRCLVEDDPWLDEGLSMLAQDFAVQQLYPSLAYDVDEGLSFAALYLRAPQSFDIGWFEGIDAGQSAPAFDCNGCFGGAYLLQRYLYNRFGGDAYTRAMESASGTSQANLISVTGEGYGPLLGDFSIALMAAQNGIQAGSSFSFAPNPAGTYSDQYGSPLTLPGIGMAGTLVPGTSSTFESCQGCVLYVGIPTNGVAASLSVVDVSAQNASLAAGVVQH